MSADDYIAAQPVSHRPAMQQLRSLVHSVVPEATEKISYGIICFRYRYMLVGIGATKSAVSLHTMNPELVSSMVDELGGVPHSGATLHFAPEEPLPTGLITDLIRKRERENEERAARQSVPRNSPQHRETALVAAGKAREVLGLFERHEPGDLRPRQAIDAITAWASRKRTLGMAEVRRLSLAAHAAARGATRPSARFAARAAGHAVAVWHVPSHAEGAHLYAAKALKAADTKSARRS